MRDLSMHVLDIAQNSVKANASKVTIRLAIDVRQWLRLEVIDDGDGMSPELLAKVADPFTTTRTTRKVGLGIPLLKENAERTGGAVQIISELGKGTTLTATFDLGNIDCPPMGSMCDTLLTLVVLNPQIPDFVFEACSPGQEANFDTRTIRQTLGDIALNEPDVIDWMRASLNEEFKPILEV